MKQTNRWLLAVALLVGVGGMLYGYDIGVIAGALLFIHQSIPLSTWQTGMIVSAVLAGGWMGALASGWFADRYGRRSTLLVNCGVFTLGVLMMVAARDFTMLLGARLLLGTAIGVLSVVVPLYVSEMMPEAHRGRYVGFFQALITLGIVSAYAVDWSLTPGGHWRWMFAVILLPTAVLLTALCFFPETPRWLMKAGREAEARKVLSRILGPDAVEEATHTIARSVEEEGGWSALLQVRYLPLLALTMVVAILNQWTGINAILQYAPDMLKDAGVASNAVAMIGSVGIGMLNLVATVLALCVVDRWGRRRLLMVGTAGVCCAEGLVALAYALPSLSPYLPWITLSGMLLFILFFAVGPGLCIWLVLAELFPTVVRGVGMALCLFTNALAGWLLSFVFPWAVASVGLGPIFLACACCSALYYGVVRFWLPETACKSLESIQERWSAQSKAYAERAA